jgi:indole-3-glycerol phosphate synthase
MSTYLDDIIAHKRIEIADLKLFSENREREIFDFYDSIRSKPIIAEIKKASPSMGDINTAVDIVARAKDYEAGGAGAVSVLTDEKYFKGSILFLKEIADAVSIPVLCKDFIINPLQIENAHRAGADCVLLIAAALETDEIAQLSERARELKLQILFEIHDLDEYEKIRDLKPKICGINSRNLKTFEIDTDNAGKIISQLKHDGLIVAESGIEKPEDLVFYDFYGADAYLIGTALMKADDPVKMIRDFNRVL